METIKCTGRRVTYLLAAGVDYKLGRALNSNKITLSLCPRWERLGVGVGLEGGGGGSGGGGGQCATGCFILTASRLAFRWHSMQDRCSKGCHHNAGERSSANLTRLAQGSWRRTLGLPPPGQSGEKLAKHMSQVQISIPENNLFLAMAQMTCPGELSFWGSIIPNWI